MWRKGDPSTLLVGIQTSTTTVGNSMEFPQKVKNGAGRVAQLIGASSYTSKGCSFNPWSGHIPGLWVWSPMLLSHTDVSLSLSSPSSLSKINKHILGWGFLKKLKMEIPLDPVILLLGTYLEEPEMLIWKNICTYPFAAALLTIAKIWKQFKCHQ